jgi:hypothetical protein
MGFYEKLLRKNLAETPRSGVGSLLTGRQAPLAKDMEGFLREGGVSPNEAEAVQRAADKHNIEIHVVGTKAERSVLETPLFLSRTAPSIGARLELVVKGPVTQEALTDLSNASPGARVSVREGVGEPFTETVHFRPNELPTREKAKDLQSGQTRNNPDVNNYLPVGVEVTIDRTKNVITHILAKIFGEFSS